MGIANKVAAATPFFIVGFLTKAKMPTETKKPIGTTNIGQMMNV